MISVECFGVPLRLSAPPSLLDRATSRLPPGWRRSRPWRHACPCIVREEHDAFAIEIAGESRGRFSTTESLLFALEGELARSVAERSPGMTFVHAGVVSIGGRVVVVPGPSRSGKTTLVAELVRRGAVYYSDEYAVLDPTGRVWPFARPLRMRTFGGSPGRRTTAEALGGRRGTEPARIGLVFAVRYANEASSDRWPASPARGALHLLANTVSARSRPAEALRAVTTAVAGAQVVEGTRGDAKTIAEALIDAADDAAEIATGDREGGGPHGIGSTACS